MAGHILSAVRASSPFTVNYDALSNTLSTTSMLTQSREQASLHLTQRVILELATRGNAVIVGRGSQFLLHGAPRTLHIYIFAPLPYRIENVMRRYHVTYSEATHRIEQADFEHNRYLRHYYGNDGHQPGLYHLLINTGLFSFELAVNLIYESLPVIKEIR
jgi:cytidylate kinase